MECLSWTSLLLIILISACFPHRSDQSFDHVMSPSSWTILGSPAPSAERLTCDHVSNKCDMQNCSLTACVPFLANGSQASYIVVLNGGESSLQLNIVVLPAKKSMQGLLVSGHQVMKVNLPSNARADSSLIVVRVGDGEECRMNLESPIPQGFYPTYITPLHGTYLLFGAALCIGGSWACCKLVRRPRGPLDGVSYRELEMEQDSSTQTHQGNSWDQNWDEEWDHDEEKGVRSPTM